MIDQTRPVASLMAQKAPIDDRDTKPDNVIGALTDVEIYDRWERAREAWLAAKRAEDDEQIERTAGAYQSAASHALERGLIEAREI